MISTNRYLDLAGFNTTYYDLPIDTRLVLSETDMLKVGVDALTPNRAVLDDGTVLNFPNHYICLCTDNNKLYVFNESAAYSIEDDKSKIGKFKNAVLDDLTATKGEIEIKLNLLKTNINNAIKPQITSISNIISWPEGYNKTVYLYFLDIDQKIGTPEDTANKNTIYGIITDKTASIDAIIANTTASIDAIIIDKTTSIDTTIADKTTSIDMAIINKAASIDTSIVVLNDSLTAVNQLTNSRLIELEENVHNKIEPTIESTTSRIGQLENNYITVYQSLTNINNSIGTINNSIGTINDTADMPTIYGVVADKTSSIETIIMNKTASIDTFINNRILTWYYTSNQAIDLTLNYNFETMNNPKYAKTNDILYYKWNITSDYAEYSVYRKIITEPENEGDVLWELISLDSKDKTQSLFEIISTTLQGDNISENKIIDTDLLTSDAGLVFTFKLKPGVLISNNDTSIPGTWGELDANTLEKTFTISSETLKTLTFEDHKLVFVANRGASSDSISYTLQLGKTIYWSGTSDDTLVIEKDNWALLGLYKTGAISNIQIELGAASNNQKYLYLFIPIGIDNTSYNKWYISEDGTYIGIGGINTYTGTTITGYNIYRSEYKQASANLYIKRSK